MADDREKPNQHDEAGKQPHKKRRHKSHGGGHGKKHEEHEGAPEWLISFADNVTLMMGFFVIMLAMNMNKESDGPTVSRSESEVQDDTVQSSGWTNVSHPPFIDAAIAIREAFNNPVDMNSTNPNDIPLIRRIQERTGSGVSTTPGQTGPHGSVQSVRTSDYYSRSGVIPFSDYADSLNEQQRESVAEIAALLRGQRFIVEVRGHVSAAEAGQSVERALSLSHQRALVVAHELAARGVPWSRLRVVAVGDADRVVPLAYDPEGHSVNQRVEVMTTREVAPEDPHLREQQRSR
ncbi:MAG: hypothetical protein EA379_08665 [Phycisphaerales bacterium]|nr:MAG: hypothetical protein EA379_08665 [Phycisphaerales bacterium]